MENAKEIGTQLVSLYRDGKAIDAIEQLYADHVVNVEASQGSTPSREIVGKKAVLEKAKWWAENNQVHHVELVGPLPHGASKFAVFFRLDLTNKQMNNTRLELVEVGVYEIAAGKVVHEEFFYDNG